MQVYPWQFFWYNLRMTKSPFKLVCFDLNETLIHENTWVDLNRELGVTAKEDQAILKDYEEGRTTYEEGQKRLEKIYKIRNQATKEKVLEVIHKYKYKPDAQETVKYLQQAGYTTCLLSGSIDLLVESVAKELAISLYGSNNKFPFHSDGSLESLTTLGQDAAVKITHLLEFCSQLHIDPTECVCVGDSLSDVGIFQVTEHGITFQDSRIEQFSWKTINSLADLRHIL